MNLQTKIPLTSSKNQFGYKDKLLLLGSCFAENIGQKLEYYKFQATTNPFGILFHPLAIERVLLDACEDRDMEETIFELDGVWKSFVAHSRLNATSRGVLLDRLNNAKSQLRNTVKEASHIFITLGTAWAYQHTPTGVLVANCHKIPQNQFAKGLLPISEITASLERQIAFIKKLNPKAQIVFTVSPVRHLKDGFVENNRSKAHLLSAIHEVCESGSASYFPAYELMMDELRDYRFYASDMLHPSEQAVDYIWEKFLEVYAGVYTERSRSTKTYDTLKEVGIIQAGLSHRPFNTESEQHKSFLMKLNERMENLQKQYPYIDFK
ncbi:GSCFA domain-containing protein [Dokdonia sinensis]|uniref:GSCFA domain-containing protein n=1 Tax=Dokdonia sinensis TaxID=2479847 RepID=A0A3M0G3K4_9FLAO|nr:GSCFA domain-containing protein [Dokdonia sinensis]RMB56503.1 GSCFA domain-containing protein [Dokdonia sinensis]